METSAHRERLYWLGMILFLLGLLIGFVSPAFRNPRLGLSAHLEGVMNGMFLILVGLIWDRVRLSLKWQNLVFILLIWAGYVNWLACVLGGIFGASRMTPIAGGAFHAQPWQENLVAFMFGSVGITMTVAVTLLVWGLMPARRN
jgi:hydroxylaminobenzene mutase